MQSYTTIQGGATARLVEKKSEFIASASFADSEEGALQFLEQVRAKHRTANHNVYAYLLREGARTRYSDDGEPQKTAGLPVLEVVRHSGLVDLIVVVTRYFGGTLLGTGGLVRAYTGAAQAALAAAVQVTVQPCVDVQITLPYPLYEQAVRLAENAGAIVADTAFAAEVTLHLTLVNGAQAALLEELRQLCRGALCARCTDPYYAPFEIKK